MSFVKPVNRVTYPSDREGFFYALSSRETSSDLNQPDNSPINIKRQEVHNQPDNRGYIGYFQVGESALYDAGFFTIPYKFSTDKKSSFQKAITNNDWVGSWTGKDGVNSKADYLRGRRHQLTAINILVNKNCGYIRNDNINEFYGKIMNGVELTESGCIAASHLVGYGSLKKYALSDGKINKEDGNGTSVQDYMDLLNYYDMETCCNRKIYITVKDNNSPVSGIAVQVESEYKAGKHYSKIGKIKNTYTTSKDGKIPVIVRHPGAVIKVTVNGKTQTIVQEASKRQSYTIDITGSIKATGKLDKPSTPQPRPVPEKSPQDQRNEQNNRTQAQPSSSSNEKKEVTFNVTIVEGDTKKPITSMRYYIIYKGNKKEHRTNNKGIENNIIATEGQDIEIGVAGDSKLQAIYSFKVNSSHEGKTISVPLPVESFKIKVIDAKRSTVKNTYFMIFYRGRQIVKKTNSQGFFNLKMLVGFVYGFGQTNGTELVKVRCLKGIDEQRIKINGAAKATALRINIMRDKLGFNPNDQPTSNTNSSTKSNKLSKVESEPVATKKVESNTQTKGNPITSVVTSQPTSDTTRYHIYHNGKIKRQNASATGYAEFIYYDEKGSKHNLGKSAYKVGQRWRSKGNADGNNKVYLVDIRNFLSYSKGKVEYKMIKNSEGSIRYFLSGLGLAAYLGTLCKLGYTDISFNGFSTVDGGPGGSSSHINGTVGDMRYLRKDFKALPVTVFQNIYSHERSLKLVETLYSFGFGRTRDMYTERYSKPELNLKNYELPHCVHYRKGTVRHHHHLHIQGFKPNLEDI